MKRNLAFRALTAIGLTLLLLLTMSGAFALELTNGITWDTTVEQMLAIEGVPEGETRDGYMEGDFLHHGFLHFADGPHVSFTVYIFRDEQLTHYGSNIGAYFQSEDAVMPDIFDEQLAALTGTYGEPTLTDTQHCLLAFNAVEADSLTAEDIVRYAGWDLGEGTALHLTHLLNEFDDTVYTLYVNETRLFAE
ncbi:MAG: hypothetical protein ABIG45_07430 [Bacillota bacterium]